MVNFLITMSIKVNAYPICRIRIENRGSEMKKTNGRVPFWTWLLGGGTWTAGGNG
jgi:hypothetical protein